MSPKQVTESAQGGQERWKVAQPPDFRANCRSRRQHGLKPIICYKVKSWWRQRGDIGRHVSGGKPRTAAGGQQLSTPGMPGTRESTSQVITYHTRSHEWRPGGHNERRNENDVGGALAVLRVDVRHSNARGGDYVYVSRQKLHSLKRGSCSLMVDTVASQQVGPRHPPMVLEQGPLSEQAPMPETNIGPCTPCTVRG